MDPSRRKKGEDTGFGVVAYSRGQEVFGRGGALGEHVEVFDAEMAGLRTGCPCGAATSSSRADYNTAADRPSATVATPEWEDC